MSAKSWPIDCVLAVGMAMVISGGCGKATGSSGPSAAFVPAQATTEPFSVSFSASDPAPDSAQQVLAKFESPETHDESMPSGDGAQFGRIVGVVRWSGDRPRLERVTVPRDGHVCGEHGGRDRPSEVLMIDDSTGGVKDAVISLVGNFEHGRALDELEHADTLNQRGCSYEPRVFIMPVGTRLAITSVDDVGHNVRMTGAIEMNIAISKGARASRRMDQAGLVKLGCDIHPWMTGYIHVVRQPYYAVTDTDGQFQLIDVPAGDHQIKLWHEAWWDSDAKTADSVVSTHSVSIQPGATTSVTFELRPPTPMRLAGSEAKRRMN